MLQVDLVFFWLLYLRNYTTRGVTDSLQIEVNLQFEKTVVFLRDEKAGKTITYKKQFSR
jgi:hypothetical protein